MVPKRGISKRTDSGEVERTALWGFGGERGIRTPGTTKDTVSSQTRWCDFNNLFGMTVAKIHYNPQQFMTASRKGPAYVNLQIDRPSSFGPQSDHSGFTKTCSTQYLRRMPKKSSLLSTPTGSGSHPENSDSNSSHASGGEWSLLDSRLTYSVLRHRIWHIRLRRNDKELQNQGHREVI